MKPYFRVGVVLAALGLAGCATGPSTELDLARREEAVSSPLLTPEQREAVAQGRILTGMTEEMVAASWGVPRRMESRQFEALLMEYWEFGPREGAPFGARLTFESGILAAVERPPGTGFLGLAGLASTAAVPTPERHDRQSLRTP